MNPSGRSLPGGAVTFLFTDVEGSTQHWERAPDSMDTALAGHNEIVGGAIASHGGMVFKTVGDAFCAAFADPVSALQAAVETQIELRRATWPANTELRVRIGIHTGTAWSDGDDYKGPTLNRVARLMSAGHGGQILVSSTTYRLLEDSIPQGIGLHSLGVHHLKDLDRPEEIFQVDAVGLPSEFGQLRTVEPETSQLAAQARVAFQAKRWEETAEHLLKLESAQPLSGSQHDMLGNALWWLGRHEEMVVRFERAFNAFLGAGDAGGAAMTAIVLSEVHGHALAPDISRAWERKAERAVETLGPDSAARGYLLRWQTVGALERDHDLDRADTLSKRVMEIARAHDDGNLEALALQDQGRIAVASGDIDRGMVMMDEAMLAAMAGDVAPMTVGRSYCNMLSVCGQTGDIRRAGQWSEAAEKWCSENDHGPYPGVCRIFKAELLWQKGEWVKAESEVMRASTELGMLNDAVGEAWYQYGEMRLRVGDDEKAQEAFQEALARGRQPVPGYALLLARKGELAGAIDLLERSLRSPEVTPWRRARYLPALIQLTLDSGAVDRAEDAVKDLEEIARLSRSDFFAAQAGAGAGRIALARGEIEEAIEALNEALKTYTTLGLPYEAALVHADLGRAYRAEGVETLAEMESATALAEFQRLGAVLEADALTSPSN